MLPAGEMTVSYRIRRPVLGGQVIGLSEGPMTARTRFWMVRMSALRTLRLARAAFGKRSSHSCREQWVVESCAPALIEAGRLVGLLGVQMRFNQAGQ